MNANKIENGLSINCEDIVFLVNCNRRLILFYNEICRVPVVTIATNCLRLVCKRISNISLTAGIKN